MKGILSTPGVQVARSGAVGRVNNSVYIHQAFINHFSVSTLAQSRARIPQMVQEEVKSVGSLEACEVVGHVVEEQHPERH